MATWGKLLIIGLLILIAIVVIVVIGIVLWWLLTQYGQEKCGTAPLAAPCTAGTDCSSCNCNQQFCQLNTVITGQVGAACVISGPGASCNSGLTCNVNTLQCTASSCGGTLTNGTACNISTDCSSCNCSLSYCQNPTVTTATEGATCSAGGAGCGTGLVCSQGVCQLAGSVKTPNGLTCTGDNQCASNNCVAGPGTATYCQAITIPQGGVQGAACSSQGAGCVAGLTCTAGTCQVDTTSSLALASNCNVSGVSCAVNLECTNLVASSSQRYCSAPAWNSTPATVTPACTNGWINQNGLCVGTAGNTTTPGLMCTANNQCANGTCQLTDNNWAIWRNAAPMGLNTAWIPVSMWPGPVSKMLAVSTSSGDILYALVGGNSSPTGTAGLYSYTLSTGTLFKISSLNTAMCGFATGTIVNFAVSLDNSQLYVALAGLTGSYTDTYLKKTYSNVKYTGVFKVNIGTGGAVTCQTLRFFNGTKTVGGQTVGGGTFGGGSIGGVTIPTITVPSGTLPTVTLTDYAEAPPWMNVTSAPGMLFGPRMGGTPSGSQYLYNALWPVQIVLDLDIKQNSVSGDNSVTTWTLRTLCQLNNTTDSGTLTNNVVLLDLAPWYFAALPLQVTYQLPNLPAGLPGFNGFSYWPYCPDSSMSSSPTNCTVTASSCNLAFGPTNSFVSGATGGTSLVPRAGWCSRMSTKLLRSLDPTQTLSVNSFASTTQNSYTIMGSVANSFSLSSGNQTLQYTGDLLMISSNVAQVTTTSNTTNPTVNYAISYGSSDLVGNVVANSGASYGLQGAGFLGNNSGWILDFDATLVSGQLKTVLYYYDVASSSYYIAYVPNLNAQGGNRADIPLGNLGGYLSGPNGVVAITSSNIYFSSGQGYCNNQKVTLSST